MYFAAWEKKDSLDPTDNNGTSQACVNAAAMPWKSMWNTEHKEKNVCSV